MHEPIEIRHVDGAVTVVPTGELDLVTAPALRTALEEAIALAPDRIVVGLAAVTFLDSTGLGALVDGWRLASDEGIKLTLSEARPPVRRVIIVTGLDDLLDG
jgi:anti-sigma B factor antagonist